MQCNAMAMIVLRKPRHRPLLQPPEKEPAQSSLGDSTSQCPIETDAHSARDQPLNLIKQYSEDPDMLCIYTDSSKKNISGFYRVGTTAVAYHRGHKIEKGQLGLGGNAEVFDAEIAALAIAATKAELIT